MRGNLIKYISIAVLFTLCGGYYFFSASFRENDVIEISKEAETGLSITEELLPQATESPKEMIFVHICGAVKNPGVYELEQSARVYEAIEKAGGALPEAAADQLNQAAGLQDGEQLYIPFENETDLEIQGQNEASKESGVNINTAGKEELMTLPGIGESKAEAILKYREEHGGFQDVQELTNISGIKNGVYEKIKELVRIR